MAELVDALDSKSSEATREGSNPSLVTQEKERYMYIEIFKNGKPTNRGFNIAEFAASKDAVTEKAHEVYKTEDHIVHIATFFGKTKNFVNFVTTRK